LPSPKVTILVTPDKSRGFNQSKLEDVPFT
jgi:hypothetical protein